MNKRELLKLMGAVLLGGTVNGAGIVNHSTAAVGAAKKKVLVIGAGLAGLAAASELQKQGHDVIMLEARERIGGRIWTSTKWDDAPVDLGASWIHGVDGNPLTKLARLSHAQFRLSNYDRAITYDTSGEPLSEQVEARLAELSDRVEEILSEAQDADDDLSVVDAIAAAFKGNPLSAADQRLLNFILNSTLETEFSGSIRELSAQWLDDAEAFPGDDAIFLKGYQQITQYLSRGIEIKLNQIVQEIDWSGATVRVTTEHEAYLADYVVVTVPLGVLKSGNLKFRPALPRAKQNAIEQLGMGVLNKCYLRFEKAFWPPDVDWLEYVSEEPGVWTEWVSIMRTHNLPVLLGFNAADRGREIEEWTDEQIIDDAMQTLRTIFGNSIPDPLDFQITRWATDPYAFGSYSFNAVGYTPALRKNLAKALGQKLFFAGEASEPQHFATAHGAYLSGLRVAKEVLKFASTK